MRVTSPLLLGSGRQLGNSQEAVPVLLSSIGINMRWPSTPRRFPKSGVYARTEVSVLLSTRPMALSSARNLAG